MLALLTLFVIVIASLLVTRVATVMLTQTGLSAQSARFQARSAFSGAGFTTSESEAVVNHPLRRRIIMTLMLLGNAGIVSGLASFLLTFSSASGGGDTVRRILAIIVFLIVLNRLAASTAADRLIARLIERALHRFTDVDVRDYAGLLRLSDDWIVAEIVVGEDDWFCGYTIGDLELPAEGVLVLGIERDEHRYDGAPKGSARFRPDDLIVLYGLRDTIDRIDARERSADGEMDWIASQIEFTERYLEQQDLERGADEVDVDDHTIGAQLHAGERTGEHPVVDATADEPDDADDPGDT